MKNNTGFSERFEKFLYWCVSEDQAATFARARGEVPYKEILNSLENEEKVLARNLIRERLKLTNSIFDIQLIARLGDKTDIPLRCLI